MAPDIATTAGAEEAQALARALPSVHEVHTDPDQPRPCEKNLPPALRESSESTSHARWAYEREFFCIRNFEAQLDNAHEVAMSLTGAMRV
jgi:hypothetical protein